MHIAALLTQSFKVPVAEKMHKTFGRECLSPLFYLHYTLTSEAFMIENLRVTFRRRGHGRKLVKLIEGFCEQRRLDLCANLVLADAVDFWSAVGLERNPLNPINFVRRYQKRAA